MIAVHEHFRFDDGNQSGFLAQRGVARQRVRVGLDATLAGNAIADGNHRAPLGKTRAHLKVFLEAVAQSVQTFGDFFAGMSGQVLGSGIHFDAGNDARVSEDFEKRRAVFLLLADGLVVENQQGMAAVVSCETSQPPPSALINWTLAVSCSIWRFSAVR
jgi:hypothetical protein